MGALVNGRLHLRLRPRSSRHRWATLGSVLKQLACHRVVQCQSAWAHSTLIWLGAFLHRGDLVGPLVDSPMTDVRQLAELAGNAYPLVLTSVNSEQEGLVLVVDIVNEPCDVVPMVDWDDGDGAWEETPTKGDWETLGGAVVLNGCSELMGTLVTGCYADCKNGGFSSTELFEG